VGGTLLAVYHLYCVCACKGDERGQRDFRGVGAFGEHRFAIEHASERHAIKAADALAVVPRLDAVGETGVMQCAVSGNDGGRDPGTVLSAARRFCTGAHDGGKIGIEADFPGVFAQYAAQQLAEVMADDELLGAQHHAGVGAPPQHWLALRVPREDALPVGGEQPLRREVEASGQQAGRFAGRGERIVGRREGIVSFEPDNHVGAARGARCDALSRATSA